MEFIQKKTADRAVEHFLAKAAEEEISLVWDRFEGQLPECGFCEAGLSCRDCLQGGNPSGARAGIPASSLPVG